MRLYYLFVILLLVPYTHKDQNQSKINTHVYVKQETEHNFFINSEISLNVTSELKHSNFALDSCSYALIYFDELKNIHYFQTAKHCMYGAYTYGEKIIAYLTYATITLIFYLILSFNRKFRVIVILVCIMIVIYANDHTKRIPKKHIGRREMRQKYEEWELSPIEIGNIRGGGMLFLITADTFIYPNSSMSV